MHNIDGIKDSRKYSAPNSNINSRLKFSDDQQIAYI